MIRTFMGSYSQQEKECFSYKHINDPVYGSIGISKLEADLINTPVFQRLRHLKQLGFASYVFPGGEHSRFVHSLGVLHIIGKMCEQLEANEAKRTEKQLFERKDTIILRIAALLHDIGHYPLSHLGEYVFQYDVKEHLKKDSVDDPPLWEVDPAMLEMRDDEPEKKPPLLFDMAFAPSKQVRKIAHHERLGLIVITHNAEIRRILEEADLDPALIGDIFSRGAMQPQNTVYYNLLHSSLDADRLDYLLRDSAQTGVKFGIVDLDYLIRLIMVLEVPIPDTSIEARIVVYNKKGQHVIEHFLMCRYFHYAQVVCHRTIGAFEMMAKVVFYKILKSGTYIVNSYKLLFEEHLGKWFVDSPEFLRFTDEEWWHCALEMRERTDDSLYKVFFDALQKRNPPRTIYNERDLLSYSRRLTYTSDRKEQYFIRKRVIKMKLPIIASQIGLDPERVGCVFGCADIEKDAHKIKSDLLDVRDEDMMDLIKCISPGENVDQCVLLAKDETSLISQISDLYSESINVFYIPKPDEIIDVNSLAMLLCNALDR